MLLGVTQAWYLFPLLQRHKGFCLMNQILFMDIGKVECTTVLLKVCTIFVNIFGSLSLASVTKTFFNIKTSQTWKPDQKIMP